MNAINADQILTGSIDASKINAQNIYAQGEGMATRTSNNGPGFLGLLTVLFVGLKLTDHIDWSWWLVLLPLWGPFALVLAVLLFIVAPVAFFSNNK